MACTGVQALAPTGSRKKIWDKKKPLSEYMPLHLSLKLTTNNGPLSRIKWEIYFYNEKCLVRSLSLIMFLVVYKDTSEYTTFEPSVVWARQTNRDRETKAAILTHNFFSWPYHAVLFSMSHLALLLLLGQRYSTGGPMWTAANWQRLKTHTDSNWFGPLRGHLHISFHKAHVFRSITWLLPLIYTAESCSEKSLIDSSNNGQYIKRLSMGSWKRIKGEKKESSKPLNSNFILRLTAIL